MAEIIRFPEKHVRQWSAMEICIRAQLQKIGSPKDMEDEICRNLAVFYEKILLTRFKLDVSIPVPASVEKDEVEILSGAVRGAFSELEEQIHEFSARILLERMILEIELYRLRHGY